MGRKLKKNNTGNAPEFVSSHRFARISPPKVRLVMNQVRGMKVDEAMQLLKFSTRRGAHFIDKVLKSAVANADHKLNEGLLEDDQDFDLEDLYIHEAFVDVGPSFKRWRPRARGMAYPIIKRTSHISIKLRPLATQAS
jgi:large subunit ribosomal protein L22